MNIQLMSPIGYTGYGYASLNILKELYKENNIGLTLIGSPKVESEEDASMVNNSISFSHMIDYDSPCLKIWHQFDLLNHTGNGKYYAFPFFEVDTFNKKEIYHLNFPDEIIVSSKWAKNILEENKIVKPISVVPLGVDTTIFNHEIKNDTNNYVFITIGKWEKRKAHDHIIECFNKAFEENDNVELWLATYNPFLSKEEENKWLSLVENSKLRQKIRVFPRLPTHESIAELLSYANCGVYISRGEGWNLELLETMAMNKPVIVSNCSAHTEYATKDNAFLVDMPEKEPALDNKWFFGNSNWAKIAEPQLIQTIDYMKYCYEHKINSNSEGVKTARLLSWKNTADKLTGCMS